MKKAIFKKGQKTVVPKSKWIPDKLFREIRKSIPIACVDLIVLRVKNKKIETLFIKRAIYPELGKWCLIGGRIIRGESLGDTIRRQVKTELGVSVKIIKPWNETFPIMALSDDTSDIQKQFVVLVYPVIISGGNLKKSGPEFSEAKWFSIKKLPKILGFAHKKELNSFIKTRLKYNLN